MLASGLVCIDLLNGVMSREQNQLVRLAPPQSGGGGKMDVTENRPLLQQAACRFAMRMLYFRKSAGYPARHT